MVRATDYLNTCLEGLFLLSLGIRCPRKRQINVSFVTFFVTAYAQAKSSRVLWQGQLRELGTQCFSLLL